jgi:predicted glycosyltransferase
MNNLKIHKRVEVGSNPIRVAFYSHDTQGLGHVRRNIAIAHALQTGDIPLSTLLITGTQLSGAFELPQNTDVVSLPAVEKGIDGSYRSRFLPMSLEHVIELRKNTICGALAAFRPHVLIADKVPGGFGNELLPSLRMLRANGITRCVLGLRDILDDPQTTRREWATTHTEYIVAHYYEAVWVYGDPKVYDLVEEYSLDERIAERVIFTGYLDRSNVQGKLPAMPNRKQGRNILCMLGGGQDGIDLAEAFVKAQFPADTHATLLTGPFLPQSSFERITTHARQNRAPFEIVRFQPNPETLLGQADLVISMGGYNSVCEILAHGKRTLIVPRVQPRQEQWIRATRLNELGCVDLLHPHSLSPEQITRWIASALQEACNPTADIDLQGLARLPHYLAEMIRQPFRRTWVTHRFANRQLQKLPDHPATFDTQASSYMQTVPPSRMEPVHQR